MSDINDIVLFQQIQASNKKWAESRELTAQIREENAISWTLRIYCDIEFTPELENEAIVEYRNANKTSK